MALIPDIAIENFHLLTPAEIKVFAFYCKKRNRHSGGWQCTDAYVAEQMKISKNRVSEARTALEKKGWIKCLENHFIVPLMGFYEVENSIDSVENSTKLVDNSIILVENSTDLVENSTSPLKEYNQPDLPARFNTSERDQTHARAREKISFENNSSKFSKNEFVEMFGEFFPQFRLSGSQKEIIHARIRDGTIWRRALIFWATNDYRPQSVGRICDKYDEIIMENTSDGTNYKKSSGLSEREKSSVRTIGGINLADRIEREARQELARMENLSGGGDPDYPQIDLIN